MRASQAGAPLRGRNAALILLFILALGIVVRLLVERESLWFDETASVKLAEQPLSHLWSDWMRRETNPPLYYSMLKFWTALVGASDGAQRFLSILYSVAAMVLAFLLGRKIANPASGLVAAALIAVAPAQVYYGVEMRGVGQSEVGAMLALLGVIGFSQPFARGGARLASLTAYVLGCFIAFYSHTMLGILPLLINLWILPWLLLVRRARGAMVLEWIAANIVVLLLWSWWIMVTIWQLQHSGNVSWIQMLPPLEVVKLIVSIYGPRYPSFIGPIPGGISLIIAGAAMLVPLLLMAWSQRGRPEWVLLVCAAGAPVLLYLISFIKPVLLDRTFFWGSGPLWVCIAIGLVAIPRRAIAAALFAIIFCANLLGVAELQTYGVFEPYKPIVQGLSRDYPGAVVVATDKTVAYSLQRYCPKASCPITILALKVPETFAADMPAPVVDGAALPGIMACRGPFITVRRDPRDDPAPRMNPIANGNDLSARFSAVNVLKVVRWQPKAEPGSADCAAINKLIAAAKSDG